MKALNFIKFKINIKDFCLRYPMEIVTCIIFFVLTEILYNCDLSGYPKISCLKYSLAFFPIVICMIYACNNLFCKRFKWIYYASLVILIPVFTINLQEYVLTPGYVFGLLLSAFLLFVCKPTKTNKEFVENFINTLIDILVCGIISVVFTLLVSAIFATMDYIFNIFKEYNHYIFWMTPFLVIPFSFLYLQMIQKSEIGKSILKYVNILVNYLISPAIILYTFILYVYAGRILISFELPLGGLATMIMVFYIVALMCKMMQTTVPNRYYTWYFKYFSYISVPLLVLFWVGIHYRILEYSFTQSRVYLVAAGIFMTLASILLLFKKLENYKTLVFIASIMIIITSYIPGFNAKSIGVDCQEKRLNYYIKELKLTDPKTGKFYKMVEFDSKKKTEAFYEAESCYKYLKEELSTTKVEEKYGTFPDLKHEEDKEINTFLIPKNISIKGYNIYYGTIYNSDTHIKENNDKPNAIYFNQNKNTFEIIEGNKIILKDTIKISEIEKALKESRNPDQSAFIYKNDSVLVLIKEIDAYSDEFNIKRIDLLRK